MGSRLVFCGVVVWMRWLVIGLLVSVGALLLVAGAVALHVWRHRKLAAEELSELETQKAQNLALEMALNSQETKDPADR
jgi:hypothetical protein